LYIICTFGTNKSVLIKEKYSYFLYCVVACVNVHHYMLYSGLIFDESEGPDHTLQALSSDAKVKVTLKEDPRQSEMLGKLLKSSNPEDLRAANRLIREMVRRDEKRMEKLQKRLDELELINNNVKLLNEMLSHYKPGAAQHEKQIIDELYGSVEKMRPQLFRMASELQQNEDGMTQILAANDNLIRVLDYYQKVMGKKEEEDKKEEESAPPPSTTNGGGGTHDLLLELADLNFDNQLAPPISATPTTTSTNNDMLLDDINLGLPGIPAVNTIIPPLDVSLMGDQSSVPLMGGGPSLVSQPPLIGGFQQPLMGGAQPTMGGAQPTMGGAQPMMGGIQPMMGGIQPMMGGARPTTGGIQSTMGVAQGGTQPLLGGVQPAMSGSSSNSGSDLLGDLNLFGITPTSFPVTTPPSVQPLPPPTNQSPSLSHIPLSPLDNIIIPLESIKPDNRPPVPVINKGGVTVSLLMTQNVPAPDVCVMIISSISTNPFIITNYLVQAAAPKAMKVKLQTPTASEFKAYSPFVPPANVSQIMLLANPSKVPVRLRFRISYMPQNGTEVVEIAEVSFPSS
jgi:ADP-ribosylation factor-binding protein GGA